MARSEPLRVAQLITTMARGGAQATVLASRDMLEHGADVTILAGRDDTGEGTHWPELDRCDGRVVSVPTLHRAPRAIADLRTLWWLIRWLKATRPDVLHTHSSKAGVLGRVAAAVSGVPVVHTVHGWSFAAPGRNGHLDRLIEVGVTLLERALARLSDALVVVTPLDLEAGLAKRVGQAGQYRLVRSGVELEQPRLGRQRRDELRHELGLDDRFVVGTVGRLAAQKDLGTLVEGFAAIVERSDGFARDAVLVIVGEGPDRESLERLAESAGVHSRTVFVGHRDDAAQLVAAFDVFALTSRWEGLPRTIVEAMAALVPVVATSVGGVGEIVRDEETGILVAPGGAAEVARALGRLWADPDLGRRLAASAEHAVSEFSADRMRRDLGRVWSELAADGG